MTFDEKVAEFNRLRAIADAASEYTMCENRCGQVIYCDCAARAAYDVLIDVVDGKCDPAALITITGAHKAR